MFRVPQHAIKAQCGYLMMRATTSSASDGLVTPVRSFHVDVAEHLNFCVILVRGNSQFIDTVRMINNHEYVAVASWIDYPRCASVAD
jgi:hypothetical protein